MVSSSILYTRFDNKNNSCNAGKHETSIPCCFNVGPESHTVIQNLANRQTSQCLDWEPSKCVFISQTNISVFKSTAAQLGIFVRKILSLNSEV